jgi:hypothetical protein|tara:strand:+ start:355 stop:1113 length:759 start_codon:yes stop_codon:yes gene_type:complete
MIKYFLVSLLFINSVFSYKLNFIKNISLRNNNNFISRRKLFTLSPLVISFLTYDDKKNNDKSILELRQEANRIIEIIEAQKESIDLPKLNVDKSNDNNENIETNNQLINNEINKILKDILYTFKNDNPDIALTKLKSYSSDMNMIKHTSNKRLIQLFNDSKYGILFKKFKDFEIINYEKYIQEEEEFYNVDVEIKATYKDLLYNGIQFNDIYYPKNTNLNNNENICYVIYKWNFIKKNNKYELVSCYLQPRI